MTDYFLGVDVGGTKSHALIADAAGQAVGFGEGGAGNYEGVGWDGLTRTLQAITAAALAEAGLTIDQISGAGFGIAGYDWPAEREPTLQAIAPLGLNAPMEIVNDTIVGLLAGATDGWGVAVVAGTSNNCRGWDKDRREGRVTGQGARFGEYGGAYEIIGRAIQAVAAAWTQRGPHTRLTDLLMEQAGVDDAATLIEALVLHRYQPDASLSGLIFDVAEAGDPVARNVITWAGRELGDLAVGVIRQLGLENQDFEVVLVGSLYQRGPLLIDPMREVIQAVAPGARLVRLNAPPVVGGVLLGMEQAGVAASALRPALVASTRDLLEHRRVKP